MLTLVRFADINALRVPPHNLPCVNSIELHTYCFLYMYSGVYLTMRLVVGRHGARQDEEKDDPWWVAHYPHSFKQT